MQEPEQDEYGDAIDETGLNLVPEPAVAEQPVSRAAARTSPPKNKASFLHACRPSCAASNVGRNANADPRWLVPPLCCRGDVVKSDIGEIEIMAEETRAFVVSAAAARFEKAARRRDRQDPSIRIRACADRDLNETAQAVC